MYLQEARLIGPHRIELTDGTPVEADRIVLTTGTEATIPPIDGLRDGPYWTNKEAIWKPDRPAGVAGGDRRGRDRHRVRADLRDGSGRDVTVLEALPHILPAEDDTAAAALVPALRGRRDRAPHGRVDRARSPRDRRMAGRAWRTPRPIRADELLVATGRRPVFDGHDLEAAGVELDDEGKPILSDTLRTTGIGRLGRGRRDGRVVVHARRRLRGRDRGGRHRGPPAGAGLSGRPAGDVLRSGGGERRPDRTARRARRGHEVRTAVSSLTDNERAHIEGSTHGVVKLVADARTGQLLGGHIVGDEAGAMIHEIVAVMAERATHARAPARRSTPTRRSRSR